MGYYTHISTCFSAEYTEITMTLAIRAAEKIPDGAGYDEAKRMLLAFAKGEGFFTGVKGTLFNWGHVGNYTDGQAFASVLLNFLQELRRYNETGFSEFDHALVFWEAEGTESAVCYEIKPQDGNHDSYLVLAKHENLPFCWNQG